MFLEIFIIAMQIIGSGNVGAMLCDTLWHKMTNKLFIKVPNRKKKSIGICITYAGACLKFYTTWFLSHVIEVN